MEVYPVPDARRQEGKGAPAACIARIEPDSPAFDAGFEPGCFITTVDGQPLRDIIDWRWLASEDEVELGYIDLDGDAGTVVLEREPGQDWGISFSGVVFDAIKLCRNACTFCFMRQLPEGMRPSLSLRDDDFRLSFLSGTFVTLTNLTPEDEARIVEQRLSPLRVSLHAADAQVRRRIIGKHAAHGLAALDRLLQAGIQVHAQVVLMPHENDGAVLADTLSWAYARPGILNVGIVPLGFTKHQTCFAESFTSSAAAKGVVDCIRPFQQRALQERDTPWVFAADEFYSNAFPETLLENLPPAAWYGDFSMFEDGIGIIRSFVDDWKRAGEEGLIDECAQALGRAGCRAVLVAGCAQRNFLGPLVRGSALKGLLEPLYVENDFFGGNVDVTGLLVGCDIARAVRARFQQSAPGSPRLLFFVPSVVLNDQRVMLDGMDVPQVEQSAGAPVHVVSCNATEYLREIIGFCAAE